MEIELYGMIYEDHYVNNSQVESNRDSGMTICTHSNNAGMGTKKQRKSLGRQNRENGNIISGEILIKMLLYSSSIQIQLPSRYIFFLFSLK